MFKEFWQKLKKEQPKRKMRLLKTLKPRKKGQRMMKLITVQ